MSANSKDRIDSLGTVCEVAITCRKFIDEGCSHWGPQRIDRSMSGWVGGERNGGGYYKEAAADFEEGLKWG